METGCNELGTTLKELGVEGVTQVGIDAIHLPRAFDGSSVEYDSDDVKNAFRARCEEIGSALLRTSAGAIGEEKIMNRALGYGNHGFLVAFPYNTPTQTLTMLWSSGQVDGWDWLPLIPRRKKV